MSVLTDIRNRGTEVTFHVDFDAEIRSVMCSTIAIQSLNARYRRAIRARAVTYRTRQARWMMRWKPALDACAIILRRPPTADRRPPTADRRPPAAETY